jgi:hypothetical protein
MADKNSLIEQMLEHLVNDEQQKAEELFHEYVVAKSREIYETLIEEEMKDEEDDEDKEDDVEESFDDVAVEADMDDETDAEGGDETDDLEMDLGDEEDEEDKSEEELFQDLDDIVDQLQAKFDELKGDEMDMGDEEMKDDFELETVREYVEKVPAGHGAEKKGQAEKADNKKSTIDNMKNDMGGTTANILSSKEDAATYANQGDLKGNGLLKGKPQDMKTGNINVPGGNAGKTGFKHKEPGHGAEKKGAAEGSTDGQSLFRGRR